MLNGSDFVRVWLGLGRLGAVAVLLNTGLRGEFLKHQLNNCGASLAVVEPTLLPALTEIVPDLTHLRELLVTGPSNGANTRIKVNDWDGWRHAAPWPNVVPRAHEPACIMYTSGTSGPSKGVLMPHAHCTLYGVGTIECMKLMPGDKYYITLPFFHANGLFMQLGATLLAGIPAYLRQRFSASAWLPDLRRSGATLTNLLGTMAAFIIAQPPSESDRNNSLRAILNSPNLSAHETAFRQRFRVPDVLPAYGMTEVNIPIWGRIGTRAPDAVGWVHEQHFEVLIADPTTDIQMPHDEIGQILVRPRVPFGFMLRYHELPEKSIDAWKNLWFHTGDAGTMTSDGLVTFIGRIKDCIRRRGENISASEVEHVVSNLPAVLEVAAYAVPSDIPGGEDEVMLALVLDAACDLTLEEVGKQIDAVLPRFASPRFLRRLDQLPKTETGKIQRAALKSQGICSALDRMAGI